MQSTSQLVELAKRFVRDNLSLPLKLKDVAIYLHVSDRHLSRMFRKHSGETFGQCLCRERLQLAESMLKTTVFAIKQIAGFQSVHYFTRCFGGILVCLRPNIVSRSRIANNKDPGDGVFA
jgi:AraC family transcriptional regulator of arabinose operon